MDNANARKHQRIVFNQTLRIDDISGKMVCYGNALDISEGGICILCDLEFQRGDAYRLKLHLKKDHENILITVLSTVVYQHPENDMFKTGLQFDNSQECEKLKAWIGYIRATQQEYCA